MSEQNPLLPAIRPRDELGRRSHLPAPQHRVPGAPFWSPTPSGGDSFTPQSHKHPSVIFSQGPKPCSRMPWLCNLGQFTEPLCAFISPPGTWGY